MTQALPPTPSPKPNASPASSNSEKVVDPTPHRAGQTTPATAGGVAPRLPHERDESADSQSSEPRAVIEQAARDVDKGLVDTDRGPLTDQVYESSVREGATRDRGEPDANRKPGS